MTLTINDIPWDILDSIAKYGEPVYRGMLSIKPYALGLTPELIADRKTLFGYTFEKNVRMIVLSRLSGELRLYSVLAAKVYRRNGRLHNLAGPAVIIRSDKGRNTCDIKFFSIDGETTAVGVIRKGTEYTNFSLGVGILSESKNIFIGKQPGPRQVQICTVQEVADAMSN